MIRRKALAVTFAVALVVGACSSETKSESAFETTSTTALALDAVDLPASGPRVGVSWDWSRTDELRTSLEAFHGGATWYELEWCLVESVPDQPDWSRADRNVERARSVGIEVLIKIRVGTCWATGGGGADSDRPLGYTPSSMPASLTRYAAFVDTVVRRYQPLGVHTYAIENEVNVLDFWSGTVDEYRQLAEIGAGAARAAAPDVVVADSGISSGAYGVAIAASLAENGDDVAALDAYQRYYERRFEVRSDDFPVLTNPADIDDALDETFAARSLAFLDATLELVRAGVFDVHQLHFYEPWPNAPALFRFLRSSLPPGVPIEVWETGVFAPDGFDAPTLLADETAALLGALLAEGATRIVYLPLTSSARDGVETRWGLVDQDGALRRAGNVAMEIADVARVAATTWAPVDAAGFAGALATGAPGATLILWDAPSGWAPDVPDGGRAVEGTEAVHIIRLPAGIDPVAWLRAAG